MIFSDFPLAPRDDDQTANSTPGPKQTFQPATMAARLEEANARAYEQYKLRREDKQPSKLPQDAAHQPSEDPQIPVDRFGTTVPSDQPSLFGRRALRITGLLLVACIGGAAIAWQPYGDAVKGMIVGLQFAPSSLLPPNIRNSPRNRAHLSFRPTRRRQHFPSQHLRLRPQRMSRRPPFLPSW
jgi:hypothetical protein